MVRFISILLCYLWLLLFIIAHVSKGDRYPYWCAAKSKVPNLSLSDYVRSVCRKNPNRCRIILPGGLCFDSYSNMVVRTRSQASFLLHRSFGETKKCNKTLGEIIPHYPSRSTIGRIQYRLYSFMCFPPVYIEF